MSEKKGRLFLKLANPDHEGYSEEIPASKFVGDFEDLRLGNGGGWCRSDDKGWLGKYFNIKRPKIGGKIVSVQLCGFKNPGVRPPGL